MQGCENRCVPCYNVNRMTTIEADSRPNVLLGKGLYTQTEAAEIISLRLPGIKRQTVANWAYGESGDHAAGKRVFSTELDLPPGERILTFLDLVELHFIAMFRRAGVKLLVIRAAAARAATLYEAISAKYAQKSLRCSPHTRK